MEITVLVISCDCRSLRSLPSGCVAISGTTAARDPSPSNSGRVDGMHCHYQAPCPCGNKPGSSTLRFISHREGGAVVLLVVSFPGSTPKAGDWKLGMKLVYWQCVTTVSLSHSQVPFPQPWEWNLGMRLVYWQCVTTVYQPPLQRLGIGNWE